MTGRKRMGLVMVINKKGGIMEFDWVDAGLVLLAGLLATGIVYLFIML